MSDASMNDIPRSPRWSGRGTAALVLVLIALAGVLLGVALDRYVFLARHGGRYGHMWYRPPFGGAGRRDPSDPAAVHRASARLARVLALTDVQHAQVDSIMARRMTALRDVRRETETRVHTMLEETRQEIERVLTPEQRARFETMHQNMRRGWEESRPPAPPGPPPAPSTPAPAPAR